VSEFYALQNSVGQILFDSSLMKVVLKQRDVSTPLLFIYGLEQRFPKFLQVGTTFN
jgi:hypothetical protein